MTSILRTVAIVLLATPMIAAQQAVPPGKSDGKSARGATAAFDRTDFDIPHKLFTLENGLKLIVHDYHSSPIVAVKLWYRVGS